MVEGVQVTLPTYEEAVSGSRPPTSAESRVQIVLLEGQHTTAPEAGPSRPSYLKQQQLESAVVHPVPPSSSSPSPSSSTWALENTSGATSSSHRIPSAGSDQHNLSLDSELDYSDGTTPIRHQFFSSRSLAVRWRACSCLQICRCWRRPENVAELGAAREDQGGVWPLPINSTRLQFVQRNQPNTESEARPESHWPSRRVAE